MKKTKPKEKEKIKNLDATETLQADKLIKFVIDENKLIQSVHQLIEQIEKAP